MAKKQTKITKEETLETILFNCRNSLRGRAAMTDKRGLLLTLVFLKFIGERFKQQKEKIRHEIVEVQGIHDEAFVELQLSRPNQYMQDGVFFRRYSSDNADASMQYSGASCAIFVIYS